MERFKDFDAFYAEMKRDPVRLRIYGEDHELPPAIPATLVLSYHRMRQRKADDAVPDDEILSLFESVFGKERAESWYAKGLDIEMIAEFLGWAMQQYGVSNSPNAPRTKRGRPRT
jgi:hypothetical protein